MLASAMQCTISQKYPEERIRQNWPLQVGMTHQGWDSPGHCRYLDMVLFSQAHFTNRRNVYTGHD